MRNRRWSGALLLILCAMLLSACSKQPKCSGQTRSDAAAAAETTDALAVALTVVSGRYSTGFFTSDKQPQQMTARCISGGGISRTKSNRTG